MSKQKNKLDYQNEAQILGLNIEGLTIKELKEQIKSIKNIAINVPKSTIVTTIKSGDLYGMFTTKHNREVLKGGYVEKHIFDKLTNSIKEKNLKDILSLGIVRKLGIIKRLIEINE